MSLSAVSTFRALLWLKSRLNNHNSGEGFSEQFVALSAGVVLRCPLLCLLFFMRFGFFVHGSVNDNYSDFLLFTCNKLEVCRFLKRKKQQTDQTFRAANAESIMKWLQVQSVNQQKVVGEAFYLLRERFI